MRVYDPVSRKWVYRKRLCHYDEPGQARCLTFSCFHRYRFLEKDRTRQWFLEALQAARTQWGFALWAYVLMPEHVHVLLCPRPGDPNLTGILRDLKEPVGRKGIAFLKEHAPEWLARVTVGEGNRIRHRFWQPGAGYDRNVIQMATVRHEIEYLHANPVRRGLAALPVDWEWSSARWYAGMRPVLLDMDPLPLDG
jgi:putative transposase